MTISARALTFALHEHDFAVRAASYGIGSRETVISAVSNLPQPELEELKKTLRVLVKAAVMRTEAALRDMEVDLDMKCHPMNVRSSYKTPIGRAEADKQP